MASVNVSSLQGLGLFKPGRQGGYDIDGNGVLDRPELAKASLNLMGQENPDAQAAGRLLATFVQGGKDKQGLLPDYNGDNALSAKELAQFAGGKPTITSQNFQQTFGDRYQPGGSSLDIPGLQNIAQQNLPKYGSNDPGTFTNSLGTLGAGITPQFLQMFSQVMMMIQQYLGGGQGGQQPGS